MTTNRYLLLAMIGLTATASLAAQFEINAEVNGRYFVMVGDRVLATTDTAGQTRVREYRTWAEAAAAATAAYSEAPASAVRVLRGSSWRLSGDAPRVLDNNSNRGGRRPLIDDRNDDGGDSGTGGNTGSNTDPNVGSGGGDGGNTGSSTNDPTDPGSNGGAGGGSTDPQTNDPQTNDPQTNDPQPPTQPQNPEPQVGGNNLVVTDFNVNALLQGAQMVYVSPNGTGDGTAPDRPMSFDGAISKHVGESGRAPKHVALRLAPGTYSPAVTSINNSAGLSAQKPLIICPRDLNGPPPVFKKGLLFRGGYANVVLYGLAFDGLVTATDPNGNTVSARSSSAGIYCSTLSDVAGPFRIVRCRIVDFRQALIVQNQTGGTGMVPVEVRDSILARTTASAIYTLGGKISVINTWVLEGGSHSTKDHGLYLADAGSLFMQNVGMVANSAAGLKIQTMRRGGPYVVRDSLAVANGEVAFACNVNASTDDPWRGVTGLIAEGNVMTNSHMRMFDIGANNRTIYRRNRVIDSQRMAWLFTLQTGGSPFALGTEDVTLEDNTSFNAGPIVVYSDAIRDGLTQPYIGVKVRGNVFVQTRAPANPNLPPVGAIAAKNAAIGFRGVQFDSTRPNIYATSYVDAKGFTQWGIQETGTKSADWWRQNSPEPFKTTGVPTWKDPGRTAFRYNAEVLGGKPTLESLMANIYAGKMTVEEVWEWIDAGYRTN